MRSAQVMEMSKDESGFEELRAETRNVIPFAPLVVVAVILIYAAIQPLAVEPTIWLVIFPLLAIAGAGQFRRYGHLVTRLLLLLGLGVSALAAVVINPGGPFIFSFPLLVILASVLFGGLSAFGVAGLTTAMTLSVANHFLGLAAPDSLNAVILFTCATAALAWLSERPTRTALDWAWSNYRLALKRTEELRGRQNELGRLAKSLGETCDRLEQLNAELERARQTAEDARRLKSEFAAAISHELRTPRFSPTSWAPPNT